MFFCTSILCSLISIVNFLQIESKLYELHLFIKIDKYYIM